MREKIIRILNTSRDASLRFEALEKFYECAETEGDILFVISILNNDADPCVRHEAAAQLFRLEEKKSWLFSGELRNMAIRALLARANYDQSIVVQHELIEALGYLIDREHLSDLEAFMGSDNIDISSTARISARVARIRIEKGISASMIGQVLIDGAEVPD